MRSPWAAMASLNYPGQKSKCHCYNRIAASRCERTAMPGEGTSGDAHSTSLVEGPVIEAINKRDW
jgi:hypothetical protein